MKSSSLVLSIMGTLFFALGNSAVAQSASPILQYNYQDQMNGSTVQILSNGTIIHGESAYPPRLPYPVVPTAALTAAELSDLKNNIANASASQTLSRQPSPSTMGSFSGQLSVIQSGKNVVIFSITRNINRPGVKSVNSSDGAKKIDQLIQSLVKHFPDGL